jgi:hypothetical protein
MATAIKVQGTQLYMVDTATTSVEIGNIQSFNPPSPNADEIEITSTTSTAKEFLQGLVDYGEGSFELNFDPSNASQQKVIAALQAGTTKEFIIGLSDGTTAAPTVAASAFGAPATTRSWIKFSGFIKAFQMQGATNNVVKATMTVRNSGSPTFTYKV